MKKPLIVVGVAAVIMLVAYLYRNKIYHWIKHRHEN